MKTLRTLLALLLIAPFAFGQAPESDEAPPDPLETLRRLQSEGVRLRLTEDGSSQVKFTYAIQAWARYAQLNPGSRSESGSQPGEAYDFVLRRSRFIVSANIESQWYFYTQFGSNSHTVASGKREMFVHDLYLMKTVVPEKLYLGAGQHYWNGISRMSNCSFAKQAVVDHPHLNYPNLGTTDLAGRQLGVFAKGQLGRLAYRAALNRPFDYDGTDGGTPPTGRAVARTTGTLAAKGYAYFAFKDTEKHVSAPMSLTYLGEKEILSVGAGFDWHPRSAASLDGDGRSRIHDRLSLGVDLFYEKPLPDGSAVSVYAAAYRHRLGPNYLKAGAASNIHSGGEMSVQGGGVRQFTLGTGEVGYAQLGYVLPPAVIKKGKLMSAVSAGWHLLEGLDEPGHRFSAGATYFLTGHRAKFTAQYDWRPVYSGTIDGDGVERANRVETYKGAFVLQAQFML